MPLTKAPKQPEEKSMIWDLLKEPLVRISAGILGGFGVLWGVWRRRIARREAAERLWNYFVGLPPETKAVLVYFHDNHTHTLRGNPGAPAIRLLLRNGILALGPGGGTYDAVNSYLTIRPDIWEMMNRWESRAPADIAAARHAPQDPRNNFS